MPVFESSMVRTRRCAPPQRSQGRIRCDLGICSGGADFTCSLTSLLQRSGITSVEAYTGSKGRQEKCRLVNILLRRLQSRRLGPRIYMSRGLGNARSLEQGVPFGAGRGSGRLCVQLVSENPEPVIKRQLVLYPSPLRHGVPPLWNRDSERNRLRLVPANQAAGKQAQIAARRPKRPSDLSTHPLSGKVLVSPGL